MNNEYTYDVDSFKNIFEHEYTFINGFMRNVHRYKNKPAMFCTHTKREWTYAQLNQTINQFANALQKDGVKRNDIIMYQLPNSAEFVFCYLAPQKLGAINCPINFKLAPGETAMVIDDSKPVAFIYEAEYKENVIKALEMAKFKPSIVVMADITGTCEVPSGHVRFEDYIKGQPLTGPTPDSPLHIYDEVTRLYTSGTTGRPKAVPMNNINEILTAHDCIMHLPLDPNDKTMNLTPWFHRGGLHFGGPTPTLYCGGEIFIMREYSPKLCLDCINRYHLTYIVGVPSALQTLAKKQEKAKLDLSSLRGIITMGSPLEKNACEYFQKTLSPNIFNGYGTTETFFNTFLRPFDLPNMGGTAGRSLTDDEVIVVKSYPDHLADPSELVAQDNEEIGEVVIRVPAKSTNTYVNNEEESKKVFHHGYMYTGDFAVWDKNEFITILGRKDDMIISAGENIYPVQIEEVLNQHPKVKESIVTGVPDKSRGESVVAYILPSDDSLTIKELTEYCASNPMLSAYKRPRFYRIVDQLPCTSTGKKQHYKIKEMAIQDAESGLLKRK